MRERLLELFSANGDMVIPLDGTVACVVRSHDRFGIFVPANIPPDYFEDKLNSMEIRTGHIHVNNDEFHGIFVSCRDVSLREVFADECARFLEEARLRRIMIDPFGWWDELKQLYGNVLASDNFYFVIAELLTYIYLHKQCQTAGSGVTVRWKSCNATHDIEMSSGDQHEVKSTIKRTSSTVTISSKFQMSANPNKSFYLYFIRLEPNRQDGFSIQDLLQKAAMAGCDMDQVERVLSAQGISPGSPKRRERFSLLEAKRYDAGDEAFPKLTPASFRPELANLLEAVENFSYDINLSAVTSLNEDILEPLNTIINN